MRISDWSSDVCSSDLEQPELPCDDLGGEPQRLQPVDHAVGETGELDAESAHDLGAAELEAVGELEHGPAVEHGRSEEHTSELQSLMRISYAVFCLKKKNNTQISYEIKSKSQVTHNK